MTQSSPGHRLISTGIVERLRSYHTLVDALRTAPADSVFATCWTPDAAAVETATFGQFLQRASRYGGFYRARDLRPGDSVVLIMRQGLGLMAAFVGALAVGVVPTILAYPTFKIDPDKYRRGLEGVTENLRAPLILLDQSFPDDLAECAKGLVAERSPAGGGPDELPLTGWASPSPGDIAFIQHSSGTTGLQKGVGLSHRAVLNQLAGLSVALGLTPADRIGSWLPLYHDMGLIGAFLLPLVAHIPLAVQSPTDWVMVPVTFLRLVTVHRSTVCWLPNFALQFMARRVSVSDQEGLELSSLRAVINCSEPIRATSMEEFLAAYAPYGLRRSALQTSYAMAENVFAVTQSTGGSSPATIVVDREQLKRAGQVAVVPADHPRAQTIVSSGRCLETNEVRVVSGEDCPAPDGYVGEIVIRSNSLFSGYYNRPDLTARRLRNGWYWTGDEGFLWHGELFVLGRKDDVLIVGGDKWHPDDLEEIASSHPDVRAGRVVAFGVYNEELGTHDIVVVAEIASAEGLERRPAIEADIRRMVTGGTGMAPRIVNVVPPNWIVKSTAGKPARSETREKFLRVRAEAPPKTRSVNAR